MIERKAASDALTDKHVGIEDDTERRHQTNEKVIMLRKKKVVIRSGTATYK